MDLLTAFLLGIVFTLTLAVLFGLFGFTALSIWESIRRKLEL
jgi:hypothetical protein